MKDAYEREQEYNYRAVQNLIGHLPPADDFKPKMVRIAGAQIPVSTDLEFNKKEVFKAIDWAKDNEVDHLLTPEGIISGYCNRWYTKLEQIADNLKEIEEYQKKCGVGLHIGTLFEEPESSGKLHRNQIRHYSPEGYFLGITNKTWVLQSEECIGRDNIKDGITDIPLFTDGTGIGRAAGMICNDMWGWGERPHTLRDDSKMRMYPMDLIFHATNGRNFLEDDTQFAPFNAWADGFLRMTAYKTLAPILTVDSPVKWDWDGNEDTLDMYPTSSESGLLDFTGWKTSVPRYGRQYFYYDLDVAQSTKFKFARFLKDTDKPFDLLVTDRDGKKLFADGIAVIHT
tara:strand:+ start:924 stop:1949 length:1026 start_codon:yes stop_codon:yes gene_type:complete